MGRSLDVARRTPSYGQADSRGGPSEPRVSIGPDDRTSANTASASAGQARDAQTPNGRSATPQHSTEATGSTHRNEPLCPKCPNVAGEFEGPVQWGRFAPRISTPRPQSHGANG